jgi:hypothetical protein
MVITGSALFIEPGSYESVLKQLEEFPEVTYQVVSATGTELVVNLEAESQGELEDLCDRLKSRIRDILEITHMYINFEDEVDKIISGS